MTGPGDIKGTGQAGIPSEWQNISPEELRKIGDQILKVAAEVVSRFSKEEGVGQAPPSGPTLEQPTLEPEELNLIVADLQTKIGDIQAQASKGAIQDMMTRNKETNQQRLNKLNEAISKMQKQEKAGFWAKLFGWIAAAVSLVVTAILTAVTGGAAAPLLVAASVGVALMVLQQTGAMDKILEGIAKGLQKLGMDEKAANLLANILVIAVVLAVQVTCIVMTGGASAGSTIADMVKIGAQVAQGLAAAGAGAAGIAGGVFTYEAEMAKADSLDLSRILKQLQATMEDEVDTLKHVLEQMEDAVSTVVRNISGIDETRRSIIQKMA